MKPSPSPASTKEAIAEVSRWLNDIEHLLTQERRSFEMETAWDHDWARTMREERVRPIFDAVLSLIAASRGTRALTEEERNYLVEMDARPTDFVATLKYDVTNLRRIIARLAKSPPQGAEE